MKKFLVALVLGSLIMLAVPASGVFAASVAQPQQNPAHTQRAISHGAGHSSSGSKISKISITQHFTNSAGAVWSLGTWNASISFSGGVPVGGWANLTIYSDGSFNFSGHFHDSGFFGYNTSMAWAVKDSNGTVYTFSHSGSVGGTSSFSSRDDNWDNFGTNPALAAGWNALANGWNYQWEAGVNFALSSLLSIVQQAIGVVGTVISIV